MKPGAFPVMFELHIIVARPLYEACPYSARASSLNVSMGCSLTPCNTLAINTALIRNASSAIHTLDYQHMLE